MYERLMEGGQQDYFVIQTLLNCPEMEPEVNTGLSNVEFDGFTDLQRKWIIDYSNIIPAPVDNVSIVKFENNGTENQNWVGSVDYSTGALTIYRAALENDNPTETISRTIDHELVGHECCPFNENNDNIYGSKEGREGAKMHAYLIAQQTDLTDVALNGYHRILLRQFRSGDISIGRFLRETHAIMTEMRLSTPAALQQVEKRQKESFGKLVIENKGLKEVGFTKILTDKEDESATPLGIDKTLTQLFRLKSLNELNTLVTRRKEFVKKPSPFNQK